MRKSRCRRHRRTIYIPETQHIMLAQDAAKFCREHVVIRVAKDHSVELVVVSRSEDVNRE
jgi:hypothetical protein